MDLQVNSSRRIAINTLVSYLRTILGGALVLFSSRWVLRDLGIEDFGLYSLVGSVMAIIVFLNTILSNSDARFFSLGIGKNDEIFLNKLFNVSLSIHIILPLLLSVIGLFIGEWVIKNILNIPIDRLNIVLDVYRITLLVSFISMVTIPFNTLFIAYQNIVTFSVLSLIESVFIFVSSFLLRFSIIVSDKLLLYTILVSFSYILTYIIRIFLARRYYKCTKINLKYFWDKEMSKDILNFSFWNMLGDLGHLVRTQGTSIVVNILWGPNGNAALGIANQVSSQASNLTNSLATSISPEIYRRVGEGDGNALPLANFASRIGVFLILIIGLPIVLNMDSLLDLWLTTVPDGSAALCFCFIIMFMVEKMSLGQLFYLRAIGKVSLVNTLIFVFYSFSVILPFLGLKDFGIIGVGVACIISMLLSRLSVIYCIGKFANFEMRVYFKETVFPLFFLILLLSCCVIYKDVFYTSNIFVLFFYLFACFVLACFLSMILILKSDERKNILKKLKFTR